MRGCVICTATSFVTFTVMPAGGLPSGIALLDDLHQRLGAAHADDDAAPLLRELFAAAYVPYSAYLHAWLFGTAPAPADFGVPPGALAAQFYPAGMPDNEQVWQTLRFIDSFLAEGLSSLIVPQQLAVHQTWCCRVDSIRGGPAPCCLQVPCMSGRDVC